MAEPILGARLSRWERRKRETRREIVDAARELFMARGFEATTLNEIAERADVANSTVFTHFASKSDIFFADYELFIESFIEFIESVDPAEETAIEATIRWHNEAIMSRRIDIDRVWLDNLRRLIDEVPLLIALERSLHVRGGSRWQGSSPRTGRVDASTQPSSANDPRGHQHLLPRAGTVPDGTRERRHPPVDPLRGRKHPCPGGGRGAHSPTRAEALKRMLSVVLHSPEGSPGPRVLSAQ